MKTLQLFMNTGPSGYGGGRPPILNGTEDEPPCHYYCHLGPCTISLAPSWLVGSSAPGLGNLAKDTQTSSWCPMVTVGFFLTNWLTWLAVKKTIKKFVFASDRLIYYVYTFFKWCYCSISAYYIIYGLFPGNQILPQCSRFLYLSGQPWLLGTVVNRWLKYM